ncbi:gamma-glutamyl-gamma-aminobutyrate hydrolase family protein [Arenimonas sp. MALMAid1274]|uniref:gamma-glutamyl-gamma-aminobutyrate hydrolase family protein n=1 Tax=Arenimonas sp. MALMAid1274 TaxID=3411630 RepID=UPI003B9FE756
MSPDPHRKLLIGLSPRLLREVPVELGFRGKTLQFLEQSVPHWVMSMGVMIVLVPTVEPGRAWHPATVSADDYAQALDGLILQGGADIDPAFYGEPITHARGRIDAERDRFEMALLRAFAAAGKPVFGICRGMQLINVACGGSLFQDLHEDAVTRDAHHVVDLYDEHLHEIRIVPGGWLSRVYGEDVRGQVNSIHHQGVRRLGEGLVVEAWSDDGVVEALRHEGDGFIVGVQWHPEFHDQRYPGLLPADPLMHAFFAAARARRDR